MLRPMQIVKSRSSFVILCLLSVSVAGYAVAAYGFLPLGSLVHPEMSVVFRANMPGIYAHVFGAAVALALGPFQFSARLRTKRPALHRWLGRVYLGVGILVGGVSGLYLAFYSYGGAIAHGGFALLALLWLYSGLRAYLSIRARDVAAHRRWMVRNFALSFAAVTLRIYLPSAMAAGIAFEFAYPIISWLCWVPNLIAAELLVNRKLRTP